jgi:4-diphosphocytidyl-2C-methyl-D-erythritol kinase
VILSRARLSTADVYREADRQGLPRDAADLASKLRQVSTMAGDLPDHLVVNNLEPAARALCPSIDGAAARLSDRDPRPFAVAPWGATL